MDYRKFNFSDRGFLILQTVETYSRTASGAGWKSRPDSVEENVVTAKFYTNYVTAIPFFNSFGYGAYCRAIWTYTPAGYLPTKITTVSPGRDTKIISHFDFIYLADLEKSAGWRENEIIKTAKKISLRTYQRQHNVTFIHRFGRCDG